ncbi:MAG: hypothetical protein LC744_00145 [Chloroflexi bacterium]|nr:hypothetical protein [Chloroflexota bacterium]
MAFVFVWALTAPPARAAEKALWGPAALPDGSSAFSLYDELAIDTLQMSMSWSDIAPTRPVDPTDPADPAYRWPGEVTAAAAEAPVHAIGLSLLVANSPPWANGNRAPAYAPADPQDYADFLTAASRRYPAVRGWMIWGEPNRADRFQPNRENDPAGPRAYAPLLDAAYAALKARNPSNKVIGANMWTSGTVKPPDFLRWMRLPSGRPPRLDWFGHNPFPYRRPKLAEGPLPGGFRDISDTDTLSSEVRGAYGRQVPLWLSEYTIQSDHGSIVFATYVSRAVQARYLSAGYAIADQLGSAVAGVGWLGLLDEPPAPDSANWGLLTYALQRKPAFAAMVRAPSERRRPAVRTARRTSRASLRARGLAVRIVQRRSGRVTIELREGRRLKARVRLRGVAGRARTIRLRAAVARGQHTVKVQAPGAPTVRRQVYVR